MLGNYLSRAEFFALDGARGAGSIRKQSGAGSEVSPAQIEAPNQLDYRANRTGGFRLWTLEKHNSTASISADTHIRLEQSSALPDLGRLCLANGILAVTQRPIPLLTMKRDSRGARL
jgi:hypothetical protein